MVELRKRKAAEESTASQPQLKKTNSMKSSSNGDKSEVPASSDVTTGGIIDLEGFGGEIQTQDGAKTTLKKLVDDARTGVVLFTYPKASTPGCRFLGAHRVSCV